ncbi:MAG: type II secretion system major pseudopilin GspG [Candidatus Omnitrophica bacterium]|nr:type II secretion system major pseudopilin GspG [Candidatus Omnitrophota bacterium]
MAGLVTKDEGRRTKDDLNWQRLLSRFVHRPSSIIHRNVEHAFTLIELMIVVIIIAALAAMVVPRFAGRSEQAKVAIAQADINSNIAMALKLYELDNENYPTTEQGLNALLSKSSISPLPTNWNGPYLEKQPIDPWRNLYRYRCPGTCNTASYDLYSVGKDGAEGTEDDVKNWQ